MAPMNNGGKGAEEADKLPEQKSELVMPQPGLFTMRPEKIAETLASREISPQGAASGMRLLTFYMNYAGKRLSPSRRRSLEKARKLLSERVSQELQEREQERERRKIA